MTRLVCRLTQTAYFFWLSGAASLGADPIEQAFATLDRVFWVRTGTNLHPLKEERAIDCAHPTERLASQSDPLGHWGFPTEGFQLSLRFDQAEFRVGEPVVASIIVRNVHDSLLTDISGDPDGTEFNVMGQNTPLKRKDVPGSGAPFAERLKMVTSKMYSWPLEPMTQRKYKLVLSDMFDLSAPGDYTATAVRRVARLDKSGYGQAMSGAAAFKVTATAGAAARANQTGAFPITPAGNTGQASPTPLASPTSTAPNLTGQVAATGGNATQGTASGGASSPAAMNVTPQDGAATSSRRNVVLSASLAGLVLLGALGLWLLRRRKP